MTPKERKKKVGEIQLVLEYSAKVYGSTQHAYLGSMAYAHLANQLGVDYGKVNFIDFLDIATDDQIEIMHDHTYTYLNLAKKYVKELPAQADALQEFHDRWEDLLD